MKISIIVLIGLKIYQIIISSDGHRMEETPIGSVKSFPTVVKETPEDERAKKVREDVIQKLYEKGIDMRDVPRFLPKERVKSVSDPSDPNCEMKSREYAQKVERFAICAHESMGHDAMVESFAGLVEKMFRDSVVTKAVAFLIVRQERPSSEEIIDTKGNVPMDVLFHLSGWFAMNPKNSL
jgi:hypothetical protein